ncbi:DUF5655 domain-containing protein [Stackebrandtia nassauensis]|uniref:DUF5655 domain-containing protein n=1 Tax=Stackebrandtia nassauensis (strain DSM 44728 / CIP 108903 / NRRL B-16338 / NBRC 102104 / LLR-40K-21) TaxID=446470 RepID=D3QBJ4_STANL|nr:DUF5655 domain-containing protein [Stackebrandtia nassauensis]ADD42876.1 hypothetical protein Snas_3206 [Stackebrandtia nassauensis DSM 44728]
MAVDPDHGVEEFFDGSTEGLALYNAVAEAIAGIGAASVRVSKSQIAFRRGRGFAYVWRPGRYVDSQVAAVLSFPLPRHVDSSRFKEVAHPAESVWMHHIELRDVADVDAEVRSWLTEAFNNAD